jgi:hypothetical protein
MDTHLLGRIPTPGSPHYIYALWFEWDSIRRYFYIGKSETRPDRINDHDGIHGCKSSNPAVRGLLSVGIQIHRQVIEWYDKTDLSFWERYWWTVYKTLGHPLCHHKPGKSCMDVEKAVATNRSKGFENLKKGRLSQASRGYPSLKVGQNLLKKKST